MLVWDFYQFLVRMRSYNPSRFTNLVESLYSSTGASGT
ncbi:hypothetical protein [Caudoviricetes sp.]|nr:hypothetical protein [Caudoviricetes sp.]